MIRVYPYQRDMLIADSRFTWNCWARQTGKTFTMSLRRLLRGLSRKRTQVILSAGERQSREVMAKIREHCAALKISFELRSERFFRRTSMRQLEIRIEDAFRIIALPANPMTARGYSGDVLLDEFAMHRDDDAIWSALFPTLLRGQGELDVASTPRGCLNMFYRLQQNTTFEHRTLKLSDAVKQGLDVDIPGLRRGMSDDLAWRQEFECEFADEASSFLTYEIIRDCQDAALSAAIDWKALAHPRTDIFAGVDVGRHRDVTAIWLWERRGGEFVTRGVEVLDRVSFVEQERMLTKLLNQPALRRLCIDATGIGLQLAEQLANRFGEHRAQRIHFSNSLKSEMAGGLRVAAERGLLSIPVDEAITRDWHSVRRRVSDSGNIRLDADRSSGGHGDRFWAAALGLYAVDDAAGAASFTPGSRLTFARSGAW